jgi:hypothetical protein
MAIYSRLVAVKFLPTTETKGSRLKFTTTGYNPQVRGYHSVDTVEEAVSAYVESLPPCAGMTGRDVLKVTGYASPLPASDNHSLYLVSYNER